MDTLTRPVIGAVVKPTAWGPSAWTLLHSVSFAYPLVPTAEEQQHMLQFVHSLRHVLPCAACKEDFGSILERNPLERHLHSREALARWMNGVHNEVNTKLGKPTMTFEDSVELWCSPAPPLPPSTSKNRPPLRVVGAQFQPVTVQPAAATNYGIILVAILVGLALLWFFVKK